MSPLQTSNLVTSIQYSQIFSEIETLSDIHDNIIDLIRGFMDPQGQNFKIAEIVELFMKAVNFDFNSSRSNLMYTLFIVVIKIPLSEHYSNYRKILFLSNLFRNVKRIQNFTNLF
jgi:hypothetical protein